MTLIDDLYSEGDEDFLARLEILTTGTNAELVPDDNEPVTILDNDGKIHDAHIWTTSCFIDRAVAHLFCGLKSLLA